MPYYGNQSTAPYGVTMYSGQPGSYIVTPGYQLIATCPVSRAWEVKSVWLQNNDVNLEFMVSLNRVPSDWPSTASHPALRIFTNIHLVPEELVMFDESIGLRSGDRLYAFQLDVSTTPPSTTVGVSMFIAGVEVRL